MSAGNTIDLQYVNNDDSLAREVGTMWMNWNMARSDVKTRWQETYQYVYATSTKNTSNEGIGGIDGEGGWSHSTHVPKLAQIFDNLGANYMAALMPHDDVVQFIGFTQDAEMLENENSNQSHKENNSIFYKRGYNYLITSKPIHYALGWLGWWCWWGWCSKFFIQSFICCSWLNIPNIFPIYIRFFFKNSFPCLWFS